MEPGGNFIQQKCKKEQSCTSMPFLFPLHKLWLFLCSAKLIRSTVARVPDKKVKFFCGGYTHLYMLQGKGAQDFGVGTEILLDTNINNL